MRQTLAPPPVEPAHGWPDVARPPLLQAVTNRPWIVLAAVALALLGAALALARTSREYTATARLLVTPLAPDYEGATADLRVLRSDGDPTRTIQTAVALVDSDEAAELTARGMGGGWTTEEVRNAVEVAAQGESNVLAVTGRAESSAQAERLADTFARSSLDVRRVQVGQQIQESLRGVRDELRDVQRRGGDASGLQARVVTLERLARAGDPTLSMVARANASATAIGPAAPVVVAVALIAGLVLGVGAALVAHAADRRVQSETEVAGLSPLPILARVPRLPAWRARRLGPTPEAMPESVREAYRTLQIRLGRALGSSPTALMVTSSTTGDGKTTTAASLAFMFARAGASVLVIDLDLRRPDLARVLGLPGDQPLDALVGPEVGLGDLVVEAHGDPAVHVIASTRAPHPDAVATLTRRTAGLLDQAKTMADVVILDTSALGEVSDALLLAHEVDYVLVVTRLMHSDSRQLQLMRDLLAEVPKPAGTVLVA